MWLTQFSCVSYCRSAVVEVLHILSRIRCNDSIMDIAQKYHYEDVIYSHQLLNQEEAWAKNAVEWKVDQSALLGGLCLVSNVAELDHTWHVKCQEPWGPWCLLMVDSHLSKTKTLTKLHIYWSVWGGAKVYGNKWIKALKYWGENHSSLCYF